MGVDRGGAGGDFSSFVMTFVSVSGRYQSSPSKNAIISALARSGAS